MIWAIRSDEPSLPLCIVYRTHAHTHTHNRSIRTSIRCHFSYNYFIFLRGKMLWENEILIRYNGIINNCKINLKLCSTGRAFRFCIRKMSVCYCYSSPWSCGKRNCFAISINCVTSSSVNRSSLSSTSNWICNGVVGGSFTIIKHSAFVNLNGLTAVRNAMIFSFDWVLQTPSSRKRIVWK